MCVCGRGNWGRRGRAFLVFFWEVEELEECHNVKDRNVGSC